MTHWFALVRFALLPQPLKIAVDKNVPIPAYQQVVDGITAAVSRGDLARGSRLPSVRNLAVDLGLNVNTVARAYRDLERAGVVDTMPGMGTFVAERVSESEAWTSSRTATRTRSHAAAPLEAGTGTLRSASPPLASWRDHLSAALALATAEGRGVEEFLATAEVLARQAPPAPVLVLAPTPGEAADVLRCLPPDLGGRAAAMALSEVPEPVTGLSLVVTTFPALGRARALVAERGVEAPVVAVETQLSEETVGRLAGLPPDGRIALVSIEKDTWDHEANDVMRIVGRSRWLKMVLLDGGERGLAERLESVDVILHVPRARDAVAPFVGGRKVVELARQLAPRSRDRLEQATGGRA